MPCRVCGIDKCWAKGPKGNVQELLCFKMPTEAPEQTNLNCSTEFAGYEAMLADIDELLVTLKNDANMCQNKHQKGLVKNQICGVRAAVKIIKKHRASSAA